MFLFSYSNFIDPWLRDIRIYLPQFSGMKKGDKVLDICCGTGDQIFYYKKRGIKPAGIDADPEMIKVAKENRKKYGFSDISLKVAEAQRIPFESNFFDFASISLGLHEMKRKDRKETISEMKRVVKKEGNLIFLDFKSPLPKSVISYFLRFIEYIAGKENFECFKDYLSQGGLPAILRENKLEEEKRGYLKSNLITIIKASNK